MDVIEVKNLSKEFKTNLGAQSIIKHLTHLMIGHSHKDRVPALKNISFSVKKGEIFGIIGPNGSGKTTLLRLIADIYSPTAGNIIRNGEIKSLFNWGAGFLPDLTVRDNVFLCGAFFGLTRKELSGKIDELLDFAKLSGAIDTELRNCSAGMILRLSFSIILQVKSDILVIDEFQEIGDLEFQKKYADIFKNFQKNNQTIIMASHDLDLVQKICQRVLYLRKGQQIMLGDAKTVIDKYKID